MTPSAAGVMSMEYSLACTSAFTFSIRIASSSVALSRSPRVMSLVTASSKSSLRLLCLRAACQWNITMHLCYL